MSRDSNTDKGCSGEWAAQPACFIWNGRIRQTTVPWVDVSANQCFILLFIAFHGLRGKLKVVSILKRSQKSKTGFLLFLGGSGGRSESLFCLYNGCSSGQWQIWLSTWASAALGGREQGLVLLNSSFTKVIFICQAELQELEEIDSLCLRPFNQKRIPAENRQWSRGAGVGVGRGGTDRPAAHNWFPKGKPRRGMAPWGSCHVNTPRGDYWKDLCMKGGRWRCLRAFASGRNPLLSKSHPYSPWLCTTFSPWKSNLPIVRVEAFKLIQLNKSAQRSALGWININPPPILLRPPISSLRPPSSSLGEWPRFALFFCHRTLIPLWLEVFPKKKRCFSQSVASYREKIILHMARCRGALPGHRGEEKPLRFIFLCPLFTWHRGAPRGGDECFHTFIPLIKKEIRFLFNSESKWGAISSVLCFIRSKRALCQTRGGQSRRQRECFSHHLAFKNIMGWLTIILISEVPWKAKGSALRNLRGC